MIQNYASHDVLARTSRTAYRTTKFLTLAIGTFMRQVYFWNMTVHDVHVALRAVLRDKASRY